MNNSTYQLYKLIFESNSVDGNNFIFYKYSDFLFSNKYDNKKYGKNFKEENITWNTIILNERINIIRDELISKACHPSRIFNWNEGVCEMFKDSKEYLKNIY